MTMNLVTVLSIVRVGLGAGALIAPLTAARSLGMRSENRSESAFLTRMYGVRQLALGGLTLMSGGAPRRVLTQAGIAVNGVDAAAGVVELSRGTLQRRSGLLSVTAGLVGLACGIAGLRQGRHP